MNKIEIGKNINLTIQYTDWVGVRMTQRQNETVGHFGTVCYFGTEDHFGTTTKFFSFIFLFNFILGF